VHRKLVESDVALRRIIREHLSMKKLVIVILIAVAGYGIFLFVNCSMPYSDRPELLSAEISIDSIWNIGLVTTLRDKHSRQFYWLKSYSSVDQSAFDTLKNKKAKIRYMKFLSGPIENRIFWMQVDSTMVFNQIIEKSK